IDTPALEYAEILLGKGGDESDRLIYRFRDHGDRQVALRFDLTVPFARFAAQYIGKLGTPFKRYHLGPVWRGENTGHGRYREFWQCDFDTIGTTSNASDVEVALVIHDLMRALGFERFEVRINNRLVLNGLLEELGLADKAVAVLRALDKLPKVGKEAVCQEMAEKAGVCSGGRYDNLAGLYTKQELPGVGASLGLDRLLAAMEELSLLPKVSTPAPVLLVQFSAERLGDYQRMARQLRAQGVGVEVYPE